MTTYDGENRIVNKLNQVENTIRAATAIIVFVMIVLTVCLATKMQLHFDEVQQELQSVDTVEVVENG